MRVVWQKLGEEAAEAEAAPSSAPPATQAQALQRVLWCHAQHSVPVPEAASRRIACMLVPCVHSLSCNEVLRSCPLRMHAPHAC